MFYKRHHFLNKSLKTALSLILLAFLLFCFSCQSDNKFGPGLKKETNGPHVSDINYTGVMIDFPPYSYGNSYTLNEVLSIRRSVRNFSDKEVELDKVAMLMWAAQGITQKETGFRTAPSAGALYPLDVFIFNKDGVFHYIPEGHKLMQVKDMDLRKDLYEACLFQGPVSEAVIDIAITAVYERTTVKYGNRGTRYVDMEAGHVCQNILLEAAALDLGAVPIGAFEDDMVKKILGLPGNYIPLYIIPVGYPE